jgi:hypothetical protein
MIVKCKLCGSIKIKKVNEFVYNDGMKVCNECFVEKPFNEFYRQQDTRCKKCKISDSKGYNIHWYENLSKLEKEKFDEWTKEYQSKYYDEHREKILKQMSDWQKTDAGKLSLSKQHHRRKKDFDFNLVFDNDLDEPFDFHHFNHNNVDVVALPRPLHQSHNMGCTEIGKMNHRKNLLPIVVQLYPDVVLLCPEIFDEFPDIATGPINDNFSL